MSNDAKQPHIDCFLVGRRVSENECASLVCEAESAAELAACRDCPHGRSLVAGVREATRAEAATPPATVPARDDAPPPGKITCAELAAMLGVDRKTVDNARRLMRQNPERRWNPGSRLSLVHEGMRRLGITWDKVFVGTRGGRREPPFGRAPRAAPGVLPLAGVPLEALLGEIRRRLPGITVTINAQGGEHG